MRSLFYFLTAAAVMGLAYWAYRENYQTQQALREISALNRDIRMLNEALSVQRAEWAYLNRPERLRELADINFDRLGLLPLAPEQFGTVETVSFPLPPELIPLPYDPDLTPGDLENEI